MGKARVARLRSFGPYGKLRVELEIEAERDITDDEVLALVAQVSRLSKRAVMPTKIAAGDRRRIFDCQDCGRIIRSALIAPTCTDPGCRSKNLVLLNHASPTRSRTPRFLELARGSRKTGRPEEE